ncbi:MAG: hypothetical protein LBU70_08775 [Chitinispirillales bacterium]|nr:hypothetical protein [Chitinispirillales bacterium]
MFIRAFQLSKFPGCGNVAIGRDCLGHALSPPSCAINFAMSASFPAMAVSGQQRLSV